jgi:hypothetical protein
LPCRMHGGAPGSGAPSGERNGNDLHGLYTAEAVAERKVTRAGYGRSESLGGF